MRRLVSLLFITTMTTIAQADPSSVEITGRVIACTIDDIGKTATPDVHAYVTITLDPDGAPPVWRGRLPTELRFVGPKDRTAKVGAHVRITTTLDDKHPPSPVTTLRLESLRVL